MNRPGFRFACLFRLCGLVATAPPARAQFAQPAATVTGTTQRIAYPQVARAGFRRDYRGIPIDDTKAVAAIRTALHAPMRQLEDFREMPLRQVIVKFRDAAGVPITCDTTALVDAGIDLDHMTVTQELAHLQDVSVAAALRLVLHDAGLTWIVRNESLTVTTGEKAAEAAVVVAYPLPRGLCDDGPVDFQSTIDLIQSTVAAQTWDTVGGYGSIRPLEVGGSPMLFVSQTCEVHDEVENVLRRVNEHAFADFEGGRCCGCTTWPMPRSGLPWPGRSGTSAMRP